MTGSGFWKLAADQEQWHEKWQAELVTDMCWPLTVLQKAIRQAITNSKVEIEKGRLSFQQVSIEKFNLGVNERPFDIAVAIRVGALDGRHPEVKKQSLVSIARALKKNGRLFIDGGNPLKEVKLIKYWE